MMNIEKYNEKMFEVIKHIDEYGNEYWEARELMYLLEYSKWENFHKVIKRAMIACETSNNNAFEQSSSTSFQNVIESSIQTTQEQSQDNLTNQLNQTLQQPLLNYCTFCDSWHNTHFLRVVISF